MKKKIFYTLIILIGLLISTNIVEAQIIKKAVSSTVGHFTSHDITGTWRYTGTDVKFKSDNLLKKAGGKAASATMEKNLNSQLDKLGIEAGVTIFTFNSDSTFTNTTRGTTMKGKYSYDSNTKYITLKYANHIPVKAQLSGSGSKMSLLFEANSFLSLVTFIGSHSGISILKSVTSLLNSYDGMMLGMELKKE